MNLKKIKIITILGIFLLCFPFHFIYDLFPNDLTALFFPVNESIWEHMKMIFSATIFFAPIEYLILTKMKIKYSNYYLSIVTAGISLIAMYLIIFLPIYYRFGENMVIAIAIMLIAIILSQIISYFILISKNNKILNIIALFLIPICYIIFGYLTYYPPHTKLFFDTNTEKYGLYDYRI